jgi:hypothetical protein
VREFVVIGGKNYFMDTAVYHRDESSALCQSMNMSLVAFEEPDEWNNMVLWIFINGKTTLYDTGFWIASKYLFAQT